MPTRKPSRERVRTRDPEVHSKSRTGREARARQRTGHKPSPKQELASPEGTQGRPAFRIAILLFGSGCCALMLQVAWIRQFRLIFGGSTLASAAVVAIFMAGLGLGNTLFGRRADRSRRPLFMYGLFEMGVALSAAISPAMLLAARWIYMELGGQSDLGVTGATCLRLALAAAVLGMPTLLMGASFPAAIRTATGEADETRGALPLLYGLNTLGAVAGALATTFFALEQLGTRNSIWAAATCNFLIGFLAMSWSKTPAFTRLDTGEGPQPARLQALGQRGNALAGNSQPRNAQRDSEPATDGDHRELRPVSDRCAPLLAIYAAAFTAGFVFMLLELTWNRLLTPILGGSTYTFGLILAVALLGLGLGSLIYHAWLKRWTPSLQLLTVTFGLEAMAVAVPVMLGDRLAVWAVANSFAARGQFLALVAAWSLVAAVVVFPASIASGMQLPLLVGLAGHGRENVGKHVGGAFGANTFGAIAGSLVGGFGALPMLGAVQIWRLAAWVLFGCCVLTWVGTMRRAIARRERTWRWGYAWLAGLACAAIGQQLSLGPTAAWRHSGVGVGRADVDVRKPGLVTDWLHGRRRALVWEADGVESGIGIMSGDGISFFVDGKSDGSAVGDKATQMGLGLLGGILRPQAREALVVGLGTGETAGWLADQEGIQRVDVVELERAVLEMTRRCEPLNRGVLQNAKVHIQVNDAREVLLAGKGRYDLIVSEPSNPYRAGIATLFTSEFYRAVQGRLADDGLFLQWLQAYEVSPETIGIILNTLRSVFSSVEIWQTQTADLMFVCGEHPSLRADGMDELRQRIQQPTMREGLLCAWGVEDLEGVLAHFVCGLKTVDEVRRNLTSGVNTDDRTVIEYQFAKSVANKWSGFEVEHLRPLARRLSDELPASMRGNVSQATIEMRRLAMYIQFSGELPPAEDIPRQQQELGVAYAMYLTQNYPAAVPLWRKFETQIADPIADLVYGHTLVEVGQEIPQPLSARIQARSPADAHVLQALGAWHRNERLRARAEAFQALELMRTNPWVARLPGKRLLGLIVDLAEDDRATAEKLFSVLGSAFAADRFDEGRKLARLLIAKQLGAARVAEALAALEPNVPWSKDVLQLRALTYSELGHPLFVEAQRDWQRMQKSLVAQPMANTSAGSIGP